MRVNQIERILRESGSRHSQNRENPSEHQRNPIKDIRE